MEYRVNLNSGLFAFRGVPARSATFMSGNSPETYAPWGSRPGLSYGVSGSVMYVGKTGFLAGADLGYERTRSRIAIDRIGLVGVYSSFSYAAEGETYFRQEALVLYPHLGYRMQLKPIQLDILIGLDLARYLSASEKGKAVAENGRNYFSDSKQKVVALDCRPRAQIAVNYRRISLYGGYSIGITNYNVEWAGGQNELYSGYLRFGASYLIH